MEHRTRTLAALAGLGLVTFGSPALGETENKTARPGERTFLQAFSHYFSTQGCRSQAALVELVSPPRGGRLEQRREYRLLGSVIDDNGRSARSADGCEAVKKDTMTLYYTPRPDFSGLDTLSVDVTFSDGTTVPYLFRITVPASVRREAPAVSQAPSRRDGGQDAAAARPAPAPSAARAPQGRAATAEDFLREAARSATPASRPAPAAPLPKAATSTPDTAPPTRQEVPQEVAPARPARPPAQRQL